MYMALFQRDPMGRTRGDFVGGLFYGSNWYQIFVGQGYTAAGAFAPLRHLWSLAVEEQFYLLWPLIMIVILRRAGASPAAGRPVAVRHQPGDLRRRRRAVPQRRRGQHVRSAR